MRTTAVQDPPYQFRERGCKIRTRSELPTKTWLWCSTLINFDLFITFINFLAWIFCKIELFSVKFKFTSEIFEHYFLYTVDWQILQPISRSRAIVSEKITPDICCKCLCAVFVKVYLFTVKVHFIGSVVGNGCVTRFTIIITAQFHWNF